MKKKFRFNRLLWIGFTLITALIIIFPYKAHMQVKQYDIQDLPPLERIQKKGHPKMESALYQLMKTYFIQGREEAREFAKQREIYLQGELVQVVTEAQLKDVREGIETTAYFLSREIEALGGSIQTTHRQLIQSIVPIYALQVLADLPSVKYLRFPRWSFPEEISEGVSVTAANQWHSIEPYRQAEMAKVCILDSGFEGYDNLLGTDLPSSVTTRSFRVDGDIYAGSVHGTACAEIIHDMAPNAELWFVNYGTEVEHHNAVDWIINQGVDIISYSQGWKNMGPGDGTGPICEDVEEAANSGIIWVKSAGNSAEEHWEDTFSDTDFDGWHNFLGVDELLEFLVPAFTSVSVFLNWDDWGTWNGTSYSGSNQDYDLYLYDWDGVSWHLIDTSINTQNGTQLPVESVSGVASFATIWAIAIREFNATRDVNLEIFVSGNALPIEYYNPAGSLTIPGDSPFAVTVGAVDWSDDSYHTYSSQGPTSDGRIKPDLCAPSRVSTESYGATGFQGTSAAAPHIAGGLALLKGKLPFSLNEIKSIIDGRAKDLGATGKDNIYGLGRLNLSKTSDGDNQWWLAENRNIKVGLTRDTKYQEITIKDKSKKTIKGKQKPDSTVIQELLRHIYVHQDYKDETLEECLRAIDLDPQDAKSYLQIAKIYKERGEKKKAIFYLEKCIYLGGVEQKVAKKMLESLKKK